MKSFKYNINGKEYNVEIVKEEGQEVELTVNGSPFTVGIEKEEIAAPQPKKITRPAAAPVSASGAPLVAKKAAPSGSIVKAPLPGVILSVDVKVGDVVKVGDRVLLLEAMKMENTIAADAAGKVLEVKVRPGDTVLEGTDLVVIG